MQVLLLCLKLNAAVYALTLNYFPLNSSAKNKAFEAGTNPTSLGSCAVDVSSGSLTCAVAAGRVHTAGRALLAVECGSRRVPFVTTFEAAGFAELAAG